MPLPCPLPPAEPPPRAAAAAAAARTIEWRRPWRAARALQLHQFTGLPTGAFLPPFAAQSCPGLRAGYSKAWLTTMQSLAKGGSLCNLRLSRNHRTKLTRSFAIELAKAKQGILDPTARAESILDLLSPPTRTAEPLPAAGTVESHVMVSQKMEKEKANELIDDWLWGQLQFYFELRRPVRQNQQTPHVCWPRWRPSHAGPCGQGRIWLLAAHDFDPARQQESRLVLRKGDILELVAGEENALSAGGYEYTCVKVHQHCINTPCGIADRRCRRSKMSPIERNLCGWGCVLTPAELAGCRLRVSRPASKGW